MATALTILQQLIEQYELGRVGTADGTPTTTQIVDADFSGPFSNTRDWARGDVVRALKASDSTVSGSYADDFAAATGTFTLLPALTAIAAGDTFYVVRQKYARRHDSLLDALNRGLKRWGRSRMKVPLTYVPDGDLLGSVLTTAWTLGASTTGAYADLSHPEGWFRRVVSLSRSGGPVSITNKNAIPCHPGDVWELITWQKCDAATVTNVLSLTDITNSATITPTVSYGALSTSSTAWVETRLQFTIPTGCYGWKLTATRAESTNANIYLGPVITAPRGARRYASQAHFLYPQDAGKFFTRSQGMSGSVEAPEYAAFDEIMLAADIDQLGWGLAFQFDDGAPFPLYFEGMLGTPTLADEYASTYVETNVAVEAAWCELVRGLRERDRDDKTGQSQWDAALAQAEQALGQAQETFNAPQEVSVSYAYTPRRIA